MNNSTYRSKTIIIIFGIGFVIYLIYIFTLESKDISEYRIDELLNQQDLHLYNDNPRYDILRVISKPSCGRFPFLVDLNVTDNSMQLQTLQMVHFIYLTLIMMIVKV
ncbi:hypothetical protein PVAND_014380 [Polypedilum vanderplanki]|uniref:Uncharacterized protein n=1 Tax=Polypedilum vanderplanki TaxID=319348 RepID=A0A9J6B901_POLVA|nr:hypothetical protein PVAND_014380 [Polypedilum vanderplanki]